MTRKLLVAAVVLTFSVSVTAWAESGGGDEPDNSSDCGQMKDFISSGEAPYTYQHGAGTASAPSGSNLYSTLENRGQHNDSQVWPGKAEDVSRHNYCG
jgi:hypothetical protein